LAIGKNYNIVVKKNSQILSLYLCAYIYSIWINLLYHLFEFYLHLSENGIYSGFSENT